MKIITVEMYKMAVDALKLIAEEACMCHMDHGSRCNCDVGYTAHMTLEHLGER